MPSLDHRSCGDLPRVRHRGHPVSSWGASPLPAARECPNPRDLCPGIVVALCPRESAHSLKFELDDIPRFESVDFPLESDLDRRCSAGTRVDSELARPDHNLKRMATIEDGHGQPFQLRGQAGVEEEHIASGLEASRNFSRSGSNPSYTRDQAVIATCSAVKQLGVEENSALHQDS